ASGSVTFPAKATLSGKATILITRASDGVVLYSDGSLSFTATAMDSGQSSGIGSDSFQLTVYDKNGVVYKQIGVANAAMLQGGNVVIHGAAGKSGTNPATATPSSVTLFDAVTGVVNRRESFRSVSPLNPASEHPITHLIEIGANL